MYWRKRFFCFVVCISVHKIWIFFLFYQPFWLLAEPLLHPSLNVSWILVGAEKILDYGGYYCGLKYVSLYVGALSPCTIRIAWIYSGWHHISWWRWWMNHGQGFFFIARLKESTDTCSCTYTLPFTHICSNIKSLHNLCSHVLCADFMYQHVCWFLHRHANMLTCHCNAYDACLWRWKLAFSVVVSLIGGDDTDCKSCWSEYNGFVLQWLWYHIIASACSQTRTQLVYQTPAA